MGALLTAFMLLTGVDSHTANLHISAATLAAGERVPAEVLLVMAWHESRLETGALGYTPRGGRRRNVVWTDDQPPAHTSVWFCGPLQIASTRWPECVALRSLDVAYTTAAEHLEYWMDRKECRWRRGEARFDCALAGYSGGNRGAKAGVNRYVYAIDLLRRRLQIYIRQAGEV